MTYSSGQQIQATDYATLGWTNPSIGGHWGVGTGRYGLGQNTSGFAVPGSNSTIDVRTGNTITAVQWSSLISAINSCLAHEGQAQITPSNVVAGTPVTAFAAISTGSAASYNNAGSTGLALSSSTPFTTTYTSAWGIGGAKSLQFTHAITFTSADAARYFFNAGGNVRVSVARSGGTVNTLNTSWTNLCAACGTISAGYLNTTKIGGSGSTNILLNYNNGGYWNLTTTAVKHFKQFDTISSGYYAGDSVEVALYWGGTSANGGYPVVYVKTTLINGALTTVNGNTSASIVVASPATTYITNTWGTPTVTLVSNTAL